MYHSEMLFPAIFDSVFNDPTPRCYRKREPIFDFFEEAPIVKARREYIKPIPDEPDFVLRIDCRGYSPENLNISVEKELLIVEGKVIAGDINSDAGTLERNFTRKVPIPEDVDKETFKSEFKNGKLIVTAQRKPKTPEPKKISIPINFVTKCMTPPPTPQNSESQSLEKENQEPQKSQEVPHGESQSESKEADKTRIISTEDPDVVVEIEE